MDDENHIYADSARRFASSVMVVYVPSKRILTYDKIKVTCNLELGVIHNTPQTLGIEV